MIISNEAQKNMNGLVRAKFYVSSNTLKGLPAQGVLDAPLVLTADGWNSGSDKRVRVSGRYALVTSEDCYAAGFFGVKADALIGLWAESVEFFYEGQAPYYHATAQ
jgi:hypothetical protein